MGGDGGGADSERGGDREAGERGGVKCGEVLQGRAGGRRLGSHGRWCGVGLGFGAGWRHRR